MTAPRLKKELRARKLLAGQLIIDGTKPELLARLLPAVGKEERGRCFAAWLALDVVSIASVASWRRGALGESVRGPREHLLLDVQVTEPELKRPCNGHVTAM